MPWTYEQQSGRLLLNSQLIGTGYSGGDDGKNNPAMQAVKDVGPIPQGSWTIVGPLMGPETSSCICVSPYNSGGSSARDCKRRRRSASLRAIAC